MTDVISNKGGEGDLAILFPERQATIAGVDITMREYGFVERLKLQDDVSALTDAITGIALAGDFHDIDSLRSVFGNQYPSVLRLIAAACDQPLAWISSLSDTDGEQLMMLWWGVNTDFFLRRVLTSVQLQKMREMQGSAPSDGPTSSPPSSPLDTMPGNLASTRTVN